VILRQPISGSPTVCAVNGCSTEHDPSLGIDYRREYKLYICSTCYLEFEEGSAPTKGDVEQLHENLYYLQLARESEDNPDFGRERRALADIPLLLRESKDDDTEHES
jgi:predicted AAA+ superfamily ATPase